MSIGKVFDALQLMLSPKARARKQAERYFAEQAAQRARDALPDPDADARILQDMHAGARTAVCFRHDVARRFDPACRTFLGGLPVAPEDFVWPSIPPKGRRISAPRGISFLGQVAMADLPDFDGRGLLPRDGVLYFFFDWRLWQTDPIIGYGHMVRYYPGDAATFREVEPPADLCMLGGDDKDGATDTLYSWLGKMRADRNFPKAYPKSPVTPVLVPTFAVADPYESGHDRYNRLSAIEQTQALRQVFGDGEDWPLPLWGHPTADLWWPSGQFPEIWLFIETVAGRITHALVWSSDGLKDHPAVAAAQDWIRRARREGLFEGVPNAVRAAFRAWCDALAADPIRLNDGGDVFDTRKINDCIEHVLNDAGAQALLHSPQTAALLGDELKALLRPRYNNAVRPGEYIRHQMFGFGTAVQTTPADDDEEILLMQFDSDLGVDWEWWDGGVVQFRIMKEDLKALRFDDIVVTIEGH